MAQAKKKFPGIFIIIAISFVVYLTVVSLLIYFHFVKKQPSKNTSQTSQQTAQK